MSAVDSRFAPEFSPDAAADPLDQLWDFLDSHLGNSGFDARRDDDQIILDHDWLLHDCWWAHDFARQTSGIRRTWFVVRPPNAWDDFAPVSATFERRDEPRPQSDPVPLEEIVDVCRDHLPFPRGFGPEHCEFKCGDVSQLFCEAIWQAFGRDTEVTKGAVFDPTTGEGWAHGFVVVPPAWTTDTDAPVIVDGTARQFCDECTDQWPATLDPVDEIGDVHVVGPDHPHRDHYALDRDAVELVG